MASSSKSGEASEGKAERSHAADDEGEGESEEEEEYTVEHILRHKISYGKIKYLVKWLGYDEETWEPEANLHPKLVEEYKESDAYKESVAAAAATPGSSGGKGRPKKRPRGAAPKDDEGQSMEWDEEEGCWKSVELSEFEKKRLQTISENQERLRLLGLTGFSLGDKKERKQQQKRESGEVNMELKGSLRERKQIKSYTQEIHHGEDFRDQMSQKKKQRLEEERQQRLQEEAEAKAAREAAKALREKEETEDEKEETEDEKEATEDEKEETEDEEEEKEEDEKEDEEKEEDDMEVDVAEAKGEAPDEEPGEPPSSSAAVAEDSLEGQGGNEAGGEEERPGGGEEGAAAGGDV